MENPRLTRQKQFIDVISSISTIMAPGALHSLIANADLDRNLQFQLNVSGPVLQFLPILFQTLESYGRLEDGRHAVQAILESARDYLGPDRRAQCDALIVAYGGTPPSQGTEVQASQAPEPVRQYNTGSIRRLLQAALTDQDLSELCMDYFPDVHGAFSGGMDKRQKIQQLLEYCQKRSQFALLLEQIEFLNPDKFAEFSDRL